MKQAVKTNLSSLTVPAEWATTADGILYTVQIPIHQDGSIETGDITKQATLTIDNLKHTLKAAGGSMDDVTQAVVYLASPEAYPGMNAVFEKSFRRPYPSRATIVVGLMTGAQIMIAAYAHIGKGKR
jgi:2-iminobutanoate/2-iminopropanoate deaminase